MKRIKFILMGLVVLSFGWSCEPEANDVTNIGKPAKRIQKNPPAVPSNNIFFGFLDGDGSSDSYIDMPVESPDTHLIVGRWKIKKLGIDEANNGKIKFYNYQDYEHEDCGVSFLQFNNDGVVFENSYYKNNNTCTLYAEIAEWEFIEEDRLQISVYNNIYLLELTEAELVLKYDWRFENSLYAPVQVYYYFERMSLPM